MPRAYTLAEFIDKAKRVHGSAYTYHEFIAGGKVRIECEAHGVFVQERRAHLAGRGCVECGHTRTAAHLRNDAGEFALAASKVHASAYTYGNVAYSTTHTKVLITCPAHGDFLQTPASHLSGVGCPKCWGDRRSKLRTRSQDHFMQKAQAAHGHTYDLSSANYEGSGKHVTVTCKTHGEFKITPDNLYQGYGCPTCGRQSSRDEDFIAKFIEAHGFAVERRVRPEWMGGKELDIFVPELNLAVEYHGSVFHASAGGLHRDKPASYHHDKWKLCADQGIRLIQVYDFKWATRKTQYLNAILHALKLSEVVYARRCSIEPLTTEQAATFHNAHHHEGFKFTPPAAQSYMLAYNGLPVAVITLSGDKVHRLSIRSGLHVVGAVSKLCSINPAAKMQVMLDMGGVLSDGSAVSLPYWWVDPKTLSALDRRSCQKHKLEARFEDTLRSDDTEVSFMLRQGFVRVHGAGVSNIQLKG